MRLSQVDSLQVPGLRPAVLVVGKAMLGPRNSTPIALAMVKGLIKLWDVMNCPDSVVDNEQRPGAKGRWTKVGAARHISEGRCAAAVDEAKNGRAGG